MEEIEKKLHEIEIAVTRNREESNGRMAYVNDMIHGLIEIVHMSCEKQKVVEDALRIAQQGNLELVKNNGELIKECSEMRKRCSNMAELLRSIGGVKIENKQL